MNNSRTFYFSLIITNFKFSITHTSQMKPRCEMASKFKIGPANHDTNLKYSEENSHAKSYFGEDFVVVGASPWSHSET